MNAEASLDLRRMLRIGKRLSALVVFAIASCEFLPEGGYDKVVYRERQPLPPAAAPEPPPVVAGIGGAGGGQTPTLPPGAPANVTQAMVEDGQQLYNTICQACHGPGGAGTAAGPALQDQQWLHITGTYDEIVNVIRVGVPNPREFPAPMPPMGGGSFNDEQLRALGAYVLALSHAQPGT
jgi:mono/diheme cytochrome c family protein